MRVSALQGANFGQTIDVNANIRNQGGVDAGSFACRYYLSEDPTITTDDVPLGEQFSIADLGLMASMPDSRTLQIPGAQAPGTYYLGILLDLNDDVVEDNETNNGTATVGFALVNIAAAVPQLGGEFRVNRTRTTGDQHQVEMDADANGNFVVVWEGTNLNGYGTDDVFFQRYNALGTPLGGQIQIHPEWQGSQEDPDVAVAPDGSFVVVYESSDGDQDGIYLRRFDATGTALGDPILVNTETVGWQGNPFVDVDDSGVFVVVWQSDGQDGSSYGVYGQRFDADGTPVGTEFQVNTYTASEQQTPAVTVGANGDFLIAWQSNGQDGSGYGVYAQRYNADGTVAGGEFLVNSYTTSNQQTPSVAIAAGGNFVVVWQSNGQDGSSWGVYGQRFHSDGSVNGGEFRINTHTLNGQSGADVVTHTDGSFLVVWHSYNQDGSYDGVYAQQFDPNGNLIGAEFRVNTYTNNEQSLPAVALGNGDRFLVGWRSQNQDGSGYGVYAQLFGTGLAQPDIVPLATHTPYGANQNAIITIGGEIRNQGTDISDSFAARYFISDDVTITTDDTPLGGPFTIDGIGALTTINDSREVQLPPDAPIGMKYVGLLLDLYTAVTEQDETNNGTALVGFATMRIDPPATSLGGEFRINSSTDNDQTQIEVDSDVNGNYVAVWRGANRNGFAGNDIYMQRYNSLGTTLGSEIQVNPEWQGEQSSPDVAVAPDGSFVVTWHSDTGDDGDQTGIYARRFNADGQAAGDEFLVNTFTTNRQEGPAVAVDDNGNFVITWHSLEQDGSNWGVYAQRFDAAGNPVDTEFRVNSQSTNEQSSPEVAVDTDGDFVVVWQSWIQDGSEFGVYAQRYDSNGAPKGTEFQVNTYTSREQRDPSVAMDTAGNFTVLWESENQDGSSWAVMGQRFLADGTPSGGEFHVNPYTDFQANPSIGLAGDGSFVVAWDSNGQDGSGHGIYVQRYAADGSVIGGEFRANTYTSNDQTESGVAIGSGDRFLVAWSSHYQGDSGWGVYGQLYGTGVAKADLVPTAANATGGWNLSQAMQVNGVIRNQGLTDSGSFTAQYYLSQDATITTDDTPLGDAFNVADLAAMSTMTDSRWVAAPGVAAGDYYIGLIVDTGGAVDEQDETNNTYNPLFTDHTVNLQALPDLGTETRVNSQSPNEQSIPDVAVDTDGDFVVAWQSWNQDGSGWGVYGQRYDALGNTVGSEFRVNTTTSDDQHTPSVAMAPDGRFVVAWQSNNQDGGGWGVYAQQYGANGGKVGDEFLVNTRTTSTQDAPSLAMDTDGDFIVVWHDYGQDSSSNGGIYGQRFNADGTTNGSEFWVASSGGPNQQRPDVAMNATGQFVVAWDDSYTVWARAFDATATARSGEIEVHDFDSNQQYGSSVGIDAAGNFVVAWHSYGADNANWSIRARRFDTDGNPLGEEFTVNTYTADEQSWPALSMSTTGEFIITWHSSYQEGSNYGVYGQRFSADGSPYGGEFRVNTTTENDQSYPNVAMRTLDDFVVAWQGWDQATWSWDVFAKLAGVSNATSLPNLVVTQTDVPANINLNQTVEVTLTVENTGIAVAGPSTLRLWRSDDDVAGNEDDVDLGLDLAIPQILNGVGHNTFQTNASFFWPGNDPYGTDRNYFVLAAADAEDIVPEISEDDNTGTSNNMYLLMADLVWMSSLSVPSQIQPGQDIDVEVIIFNNGDAWAETVIGHLWISDDNVPGNEDDVDLLLDITVPELEPYGWPNYTQFQTTVSFAWPADDPFGTDRSYYVVGDLDVTDQVVESNEDNWRLSNSMWLVMPDLQVEVLNALAEVRTGEAVSFDVRVRNYGDADASASTAHVWLSDDDIGGNGDEHDLFIDVPVPVLSPYSWPDYHEHIAPVTFTWPSPDPFGTDLQYHIAVMTDVLDVANESDETNNWALSEPIGLLVPDLTIQQTRTPSTVSAGMEVAARLQVANLGTEDIAEATVGHVWLSDNNVAGDLDDFDLGVDFEVPAINGQSAINILVAVPLPDTDPFGTDGEYHLVFMVDSPNAIDEGRENNNVFVSDPFDWVIPLDLDIIPVGHLGGASFASATNGDYAYELTSAGLRVLNIADPGDMYKVGELLFDVEPEDPFGLLQTAEVIVTESIVMVMDVKTIRVIDVSSPTMPTQLWSSDFDGDNPDKAGIVFDASSGTPLVYIAEGDELNIADVTDPMVPTLVGQYPLPGQALGLALGDNVAYVLYYHPAFGGTALETIKIADPAAPDFLGRRLLTGEFGLPVVHNDLLAMVEFDTTGFGFDEVVLLDITDPVLPRARGDYMVPGEIMDLAFHGSDLIVSYGAWEGVDFDSHQLVLDVSDPFDPAAIAVLDLNLQTGPPEDGAGHLWVDGDTIYAGVGEFVAVDLSDRFSPIVTSRFSEPFGLQLVAADGNRAAVLGNQLSTIDVSQPSILIPRGMVPVANGAQDLFLSGSRAVVQKYNSIDVYDLADSANPQWASSYTVNTGTIRDMVIEGDLAYLLIYIDYEMTAFEIIDISDLSTPVRLSEGLLPRNASSGSNDVIAVSGSHLYVTNAYVPRGGGQIVDEQESNDSFGTAMPLGAVPSVDEVQGELNASEYDYYSFTGTAGDRINIALMGAVAGVGDLQNGYLILYNNEQSFLTSSYYYTQGGDVFISNYTLPATTTYYVRVSRGYYAEGSTYRLALGIAGDVGIIDVGDPSHPMGLNNVRVNHPVRDMLANAAHLYLAVDSPPQLQIWDISDANDPVQLGTAQIAQPAELALGGNLIELVSGDGIQFVDVADPERPVTLETYHFQWPISDLAIDGGVIHVVSDTYYTLTAHPTGVAAPDLAATALAIPAAVQIGQPLDIDWTVRNHGQQTTPGGSWDDTVYLSADARLDLGVDIELGFVRHTDALDPLATYNASLSVPTDTLVPGSYFVIVHTDSGDEVDEFFVESNNVRVSNHPVELGYPDLAVTHVSGPWVIERGELLDVSWIVKNRGEAPADDPAWLDEVFLSITGVPDGSEISVGTVEHTGGLRVGEVYNASFDIDTSAVEDGDYFVIVQTDSSGEVDEKGREANNVKRTDVPTIVGTPELTLDETRADSLPRDGASKYYRVDVGADQHLFVTLDDLDDQGFNELYIKFGEAPTRSDYDARYRTNFAPDQQLDIAETMAGAYYVLVYGDSVPENENPGDFEITASVLGFSILGVSPTIVANAGQVTMSIRGSAFLNDVTPVLIAPNGDRFEPVNLFEDFSGILYPTIDLFGAELGQYDIRIEDSSGVFTELTDFIEVIEGQIGALRAELIVPQAVRVGRPFTIYIEYENIGDTDIQAPILYVESSTNTLRGPNGVDADANESIQLLGIPSTGPASILRPGERRSIPFQSVGVLGTMQFSLDSLRADDTQINWDDFKESMRPVSVTSSEWETVFPALTSELGSTWKQYHQTILETADRLAHRGTRTLLVAETMQFLVNKHLGKSVLAITGQVLGENSAPVANAMVVAEKDGDLFSQTTTDSQGRFLLDGLVSGTYNLSVVGYNIVESSTYTIEPDIDITDLSLTALRAGIEGQLTGIGLSLEDRRIEFSNIDTGEAFVTTSSAGGDFEVLGISPGTYDVFVHQAVVTNTIPLPLIVNVNQILRGVSIEIDAGLSLSGVVQLASDGAPVQDALIELCSDGGYLIDMFLTDSSGNFEFMGLPNGLYTIVAEKEGLARGWTTQIDPSVSESLTIDMVSTSTLTGLVIKDGEPYEDAAVIVTIQGSLPNDSFFSASRNDGTFLVDGLAAGSYDVAVLVDDLEYEVSDVVVDDESTRDLGTVDSDNLPSGEVSTSTLLKAELFLRTLFLPAAWVVFGDEVRRLWATYLNGDSSSPPGIVSFGAGSQIVEGFDPPPYNRLQPFVKELFPDKPIDLNQIGVGFRDSQITQDRLNVVRDELMYRIEQDFDTGILECGDFRSQPQSMPIQFWLEEEWLKASGPYYPDPKNDSRKAALNYGLILELPGNIAGGVGDGGGGTADPGLFDDSREISGNVKISHSDSRIDVEFLLRVHAFDTVDFIPGDLGAGIERFLTERLSLLEKHDWAYDVPFSVQFDVDPETDSIYFTEDECEDEDPPEDDDQMDNKDRDNSRGIRSSDPNDKVGPEGHSDVNYIQPDQLMPFTIYYENDPDKATAAAQVVRIEDQMSPNLDWSTFELSDINLFGDFVVEVPEGLNFYETTIPVTVDLGQTVPEAEREIDLLVHITAGLDADTGLATWLFESLDPDTLAPPDNPFAGFLAVNDKETHIGEGHLEYFIRARNELESGTQITNQANNYFDGNEPVPTPVTLHTIDSGLPSSSVNALPAQVPDEPFLVSWAGVDDENGSGIRSFTVYVSRDNDPWEVWLEDTPDTSAMFDGLGGHSYAFYSVATDNVGHVEDDPGVAEATTTFDFSQLRVDRLDVKPWGFTAYFKRQLDTSVLNLYDIEAGTYGPADMTVVGETVGPVAGSLIYDPEDKTISFIKTGGLLEPDTYTVTLRSGENGFKDSEGHLLDGDEDDVEGGDFVTTIVVESGTARLLSLPDFTRGPGQVVNVPTVGSGIPVTISNGSDILAVDFVLTYDPGLLNVTGLSLGSEIPDGWAPAFNLNTPGQVVVMIYGPTPLDAGEISLVEIEANVPEDAPYRSAAILGLSNIQVNEGTIASRADSAVQVAAYFGDATGNHTYSGLDAAYIARVAVGLDSGFAAYRLKDPVIVADVTGNGRLSGLDAAYFARKAVGLEQPQIPDLPDPIPGIIAVGRDPLLSIPENLTAQRGSMVTVPILVDDATDLFLADIDLRYDTNVFDLSDSGVSLGVLTTGWNLISNVDDADGRVRLSAYSISALSRGFGSIVELEFNVRSDAVLGVTVIDLLESCSLNEGGLVLTLQDGEVGIQDAITIPTLLAWKLNDNTDVSLAGKLAYPVDREIAVLSNDSDGDIESRVSTTKKDDTPQFYVNYNEIDIEETTSIGVRGLHWAKLVLKTQYVSAQKAKDRKLIRLILDEYGEKAQLSITLNISRLYLVLRSS